MTTSKKEVDKINRKPIQVLVVPPKKEPYIEYMYDTLEVLQHTVGGHIECIYIADDAILICNEEGKLLELKPNRRIGNDIIVGTFLIVGAHGSEQFQSLTKEQIERYTKRFMHIEDISQEEVDAMLTFKTQEM
jgi:CRISPR/Cas system-associated protein Cas7 (RAMP superfamily)